MLSNSLIVSATPRYYEDIRELIEKLDERPPMVMIQVLIAEVRLNDTDEFGIELGLQDSVLFDRSLLSDVQQLTTTTQTQVPAAAVTNVTEQQHHRRPTRTPASRSTITPLGNSAVTQRLLRLRRLVRRDSPTSPSTAPTVNLASAALCSRAEQ